MPKLTDILNMFGKKTLSPEEKGMIINKLSSIYSNKVVVKGTDLKFEIIMDYFLRLNKVFRINSDVISELQDKVNTLAQRRKFREDQGSSYMQKMRENQRKEDESEEQQAMIK